MFLILVSAFVLYTLTKTIYRLTLHPLASYPGPKLAAATQLYNAYYDIGQGGIVKILPELHKKYGPVIRIQPNELHIGSLEGYNQIHRVGTPFDRVWHDNPFLIGSLESLITLPETKKRKEFLSHYFSKAAVSRAEPWLHGKKIKRFLDILYNSNGEVVNFHLGLRSLTADVMMDYCFQTDMGALETPGFQHETLVAFSDTADMALVPMHFPLFFSLLTKMVLALPDHIRQAYFAGVYGFESIRAVARGRVENAIARAEGEKESTGKAVEERIPTMFDAMLHPDVSKGQVTPSKNDMVSDGALMIVAGMDTTAHTLGNIIWQVTQDPKIEAKLLAELKQRIGKDEFVDSASLEGPGFEYLRAVVKEGLRVSYGAPGRMLRRVPKEGATFGDIFVPGGTVVTSCIYLQNTDPETFSDPFKFDPERWMCEPDTYRLRDRQMVSFSRGSRSCLGVNFAYATLHLTAAHLFRRFEITTTGYTTAEDMEWTDHFLPTPNGKIRGLVKVRAD